jgi:hypothetical protein
MHSSVAAHAKDERRAVVTELAEMVEDERKVAVSATLATSACFADPSASDLLQRVAAEAAAAVAVLFASGPRLRRVLEAAPRSHGDVRAVRLAADAGGSSHALHFRRLTGRCAELASRAVGAVDDRLRRLVLVGGQISAPAALAGGLLAVALSARPIPPDTASPRPRDYFDRGSTGRSPNPRLPPCSHASAAQPCGFRMLLTPECAQRDSNPPARGSAWRPWS